jgi:hypothetical protein
MPQKLSYFLRASLSQRTLSPISSAEAARGGVMGTGSVKARAGETGTGRVGDGEESMTAGAGCYRYPPATETV